jgi:ABC-type antimicrobial peptide transport system permease subunit
VVIRTAGRFSTLIPAVRSAIIEVDPMVPIRSIASMDDVVRSAYSISWVVMGLLVVLAVFATALGSIGIYAVLAHHVATSRREMGVRMALGARPAVLVGRIVRSGLLLSGIGIVVGSIAAAMASRFLESLLFGVSNLTPWAYVAPALALSAAAAIAAWAPASRAGRLAPADVLRSD